jgi:DNA topoisomerase-2
VDYIIGQIVRKLAEYIEKKKKVRVNSASIKEQLTLFIRCDIVNPAFDSQTKDFMNTPSNKFGSSCSVSDAFIEKVAKMGVMDLACSLTEAKESRLAAKKTDGAKTKTIRGIANFMDANWSGGAQSKDCVLILCEGLSAMSGIVSGLSADDRNIIGIYPLKGKLLNVRGEQSKKIADNKEITDIKKILGLENGRQYETIDDVHRFLRYGKIMVMTDQDHDGSHIKGLCINLMHSEWASLIRIPGFLSFMNTPILRATKGANQKRVFYNEGEYETWKSALTQEEATGWKIKYFKGLGTSTSAEFKEYFAHKKIVDFVYSDSSTDDMIDKIFNKKRADDRKTWLEQYDKHAFLDTSRSQVKYEDFINQEMIHFSTYDCARSIPNMVDGLKTSLRKILFCAFKRRLTSELKVAQFSGYVAEHSAYHHGEASLNGAIVAMAQNFVGSNNIHLLKPNGQFGTRLQGGDDSASERYIFTELNPLTRYLFRQEDDAVLTYLMDDGSPVEPEYYVPIIPFVLVNGISGIGTGFSSSLPAFNPKQIVAYLKQKLSNSANIECTNTGSEGTSFVPYYEGFKGPIAKTDPNKYVAKGVYEKTAEDKIRITELPIGTWTMPYISFLEGLMDGTTNEKTGKKTPPLIKDFVSVCTELTVDITVQFNRGELAPLQENGGLEKLLKLTSSLSTTNMHLFDADCRLHKYASVEEIIDAFYEIRMTTYQKRKAYLVADLERTLNRISNKAKYIMETLDGTIDLRRKTQTEMDALLETRGYDRLSNNTEETPSFKYLTKMPMDSVSQENVASLLNEKAAKEKEYELLKSTTCSQMWAKELDEFDREYTRFINHKTASQTSQTTNEKVVKKIKLVKGKLVA